MKKIGIIAAVLLLIVANNVSAQISVGAKAGFNATNIATTGNGGKQFPNIDDKVTKPSFNVGLFADFLLNNNVSIETGANAEMKGFAINNEYRMGNYVEKNRIKYNLLYVTVPIDIRLNFGRFYFLAGPYFGVTAAGKYKKNTDANGDNIKVKDDLRFGNEERDILHNQEGDHFRRVDAGVGLAVGCEIIRNFGLRLGYDAGLLNIQPSGNSDNTIKNQSFNLSATCRF
ncbi:MAG: PorT family protein [Salinivirgaceae bacterium]|nr:PorT family protein [Salinivirgaceae bacterium]